MEDKGIPHRYGNGAVLWHKGDSRYYHITDRYVSVDTDELLYRVHDSTHRNNQLYCEEDLEDVHSRRLHNRGEASCTVRRT